MTTVVQQRSGLVHAITDVNARPVFTVCGRYAGWGGSFRPTYDERKVTCWVCLCSLAAQERRAA